MVLEKSALDIETRKSIQVTTIRQISFPSYAMRGDFNLKSISYSVHHISVWFFDFIEDPFDKYVVKDRSHGTGMINLSPGSCDQLLEPH